MIRYVPRFSPVLLSASSSSFFRIALLQSSPLQVEPDNMPRHGNFEVYVECEGTRTEEYGTVVKGNVTVPVVSCWIESEVGKVSA